MLPFEYDDFADAGTGGEHQVDHVGDAVAAREMVRSHQLADELDLFAVQGNDRFAFVIDRGGEFDDVAPPCGAESTGQGVHPRQADAGQLRCRPSDLGLHLVEEVFHLRDDQLIDGQSAELRDDVAFGDRLVTLSCVSRTFAVIDLLQPLPGEFFDCGVVGDLTTGAGGL